MQLSVLRLAGSLLACCLAAGCSQSAGPLTTAASGQTAPIDHSAELRQLARDLVAHRSGAQDAIHEWMEKHTAIGVMTGRQLCVLFGAESMNLDRPERDQIETIQFEIGGDKANLVYIVCDLDPATQTLLRWQISRAICGFCPHVLAHDGRWRLEGKMLAGRVGAHRAGVDTLVLPRLTAGRDGLAIQIANWAPEIEHIDEVRLGTVALERDEALDVDFDGTPFVWTARREVPVAAPRSGAGPIVIECNQTVGENLIVLEVRNTAEFESAMRSYYLAGGPLPQGMALDLVPNTGERLALAPVGTKFFRRIVVPFRDDVSRVTIDVANPLWFVRRMWIGSGRLADDVHWQAASHVSRADGSLRQTRPQWNGEAIELQPGDEMTLTFPTPTSPSGSSRPAYLLRMHGYYEFLSSAALGFNLLEFNL